MCKIQILLHIIYFFKGAEHEDFAMGKLLPFRGFQRLRYCKYSVILTTDYLRLINHVSTN